MYTEIDLKLRQQKVAKLVEKYGEQLYHYTSFQALYGILKNRELWLGNTASMNDELEIIDFINRLYKEVYNSLGKDKQTQCDKFFMTIRSRLSNQYPFAVCFSQAKDDAAHWERYSDHAKGVCIAFNTEALLSLFFYQMVLFQPVIYSYEIARHEHYNLLCNYFKTQELKGFENEAELIDNILLCAYVHKHISFRSECEVRLVTLWDHTLNNASSTNIDYLVAGNSIKKVLKVSLEKLCESEQLTFEHLIDQIIIGKRSLQTQYELKEFILSLGLPQIAERITVAECPFR